DLYGPEIFDQFTRYLLQIQAVDYPVHLEMETGMNRLGFSKEELPPMLEALKHYARPGVERKPLFRVRSIYSHLAASEDAAFDEFTLGQFARFESMTVEVEAALGYPVLKHITNSSGTSRYNGFGLDMVRIGIGLYGVDPGMDGKADLKEVSTLKTTVAQIKHLKAGDTVGYGRRGKLTADTTVATVRIGYADGYTRKLGNRVGQMLVKGQRAPVLGTVSMDMTMIDITGISGVEVGDEVTVFGSGLSVKEVAMQADTIPYEILTSVSQRVKRVYFEE
ncbi:MAG: alanine racemase, partial [Chitinophagaceae bacterium]